MKGEWDVPIPPLKLPMTYELAWRRYPDDEPRICKKISREAEIVDWILTHWLTDEDPI